MKFGIREISPEHRTANAMPVLKYGMRPVVRESTGTQIRDIAYDPHDGTFSMVFEVAPTEKNKGVFQAFLQGNPSGTPSTFIKAHSGYVAGAWVHYGFPLRWRTIGGWLYVPIEIVSLCAPLSNNDEVGTLWVPKCRLVKVEKFPEQCRVSGLVENGNRICDDVKTALNWMLHKYEAEGAVQGDLLLPASASYETYAIKSVRLPDGVKYVEHKADGKTGLFTTWVGKRRHEFADASSGDSVFSFRDD